VRQVVITNVYSDDNRGGAAITAATTRAVQDAFPGAAISLVTMSPDRTALGRSHRHTAQTLDADLLPAALPVAKNQLGAALAVLRSFFHLAMGPRLLGSNPPLRRLAEADAVVAKGGQLFRPFSWRGLPGLWLSAYPIVFARRCGVPAAAYAISIGPFRADRAGRASRRICGRVLRGCRAVLVRDDASRDLAIELGVPRSRVHRVPDAVFATDPPPPDVTEALLRRVGLENQRFVAITASNHMSNPVDAAVINPELATLVRTLLDQGVVDRAAVVLQADGTGTSDRKASVRFLEELSDDRGLLVEDDLSVAEFMALYRGARLTLGGRVHSNIFSVVVGTPTFPFEYWGSKALNLFDPIGLGDLVGRIEKGCGPVLAAKIAQAMADEDALRERIQTTADALRVESKRSIDLLRSITEGR
jgi:polysaccharide pyruvyl transferase WcaK-like protein